MDRLKERTSRLLSCLILKTRLPHHDGGISIGYFLLRFNSWRYLRGKIGGLGLGCLYGFGDRDIELVFVFSGGLVGIGELGM